MATVQAAAVRSTHGGAWQAGNSHVVTASILIDLQQKQTLPLELRSSGDLRESQPLVFCCNAWAFLRPRSCHGHSSYYRKKCPASQDFPAAPSESCLSVLTRVLYLLLFPFICSVFWLSFLEMCLALLAPKKSFPILLFHRQQKCLEKIAYIPILTCPAHICRSSSCHRYFPIASLKLTETVPFSNLEAIVRAISVFLLVTVLHPACILL